MKVDYLELVRRDNAAAEYVWDFLAGKVLDTQPLGEGLREVIRRSNNWQNALDAQRRAYVGQGKNPNAQRAVRKLQIQIETADAVVTVILSKWVTAWREAHDGYPLDPYDGAFFLVQGLKRVVTWRAASRYPGEFE